MLKVRGLKKFEGYYWWGFAYKALGDYEKAQADFEKLSELVPDHLVARREIENCRRMLGR